MTISHATGMHNCFLCCLDWPLPQATTSPANLGSHMRKRGCSHVFRIQIAMLLCVYAWADIARAMFQQKLPSSLHFQPTSSASYVEVELLLRRIVEECSQQQDTVIQLGAAGGRQLLVLPSLPADAACPEMDIAIRAQERGVAACTDAALYVIHLGARIIPLLGQPEMQQYNSRCAMSTARLFLDNLYREWLSPGGTSLHVMQVNSDQVYQVHKQQHAAMDLFLCRTRFCQRLMQRYTKQHGFMGRVWFVGHTSSDPLVLEGSSPTQQQTGSQQQQQHFHQHAGHGSISHVSIEQIAAGGGTRRSEFQDGQAGDSTTSTSTTVDDGSRHRASFVSMTAHAPGPYQPREMHATPGMRADYTQFLHVKSTSGLKHTTQLLECWAAHPHFPLLTVVGLHPLEDPQTRAALQAQNILLLPAPTQDSRQQAVVDAMANRLASAAQAVAHDAAKAANAKAQAAAEHKAAAVKSADRQPHKPTLLPAVAGSSISSSHSTSQSSSQRSSRERNSSRSSSGSRGGNKGESSSKGHVLEGKQEPIQQLAAQAAAMHAAAAEAAAAQHAAEQAIAAKAATAKVAALEAAAHAAATTTRAAGQPAATDTDMQPAMHHVMPSSFQKLMKQASSLRHSDTAAAGSDSSKAQGSTQPKSKGSSSSGSSSSKSLPARIPAVSGVQAPTRRAVLPKSFEKLLKQRSIASATNIEHVQQQQQQQQQLDELDELDELPVDHHRKLLQPYFQQQQLTQLTARLEPTGQHSRHSRHSSHAADGNNTAEAQFHLQPEQPLIAGSSRQLQMHYKPPHKYNFAYSYLKWVPKTLQREELLSFDQVRLLQANIGMHICPSEREGFGHYLNEARAAGALIISTNHPPMNELVQHEKSGLLVQPNHTSSEFGWQALAPYASQGISAHVATSDLCQLVHHVLQLPLERRAELGHQARKQYLLQKSVFVHKARLVRRFVGRWRQQQADGGAAAQVQQELGTVQSQQQQQR